MMSPYPRISFFDVDKARFVSMLEEALTQTSKESEMVKINGIDGDWELEDLDIEDGWEDDDDYYDDDMDGDWDSGMESAGWGTDEDYGYYGEDF